MIFDVAYNLSNGQKWNYYGKTKLYDRIMFKLGGLGLVYESSLWDSWSSVFNRMGMTDSSDYRMYLESKFNALHEKLDTIVEQTVKTNNRVNHLEDQRDSYLKTRVDREMLTECHTKIEEIDDKVTIIEKDLQEYRFLRNIRLYLL